MYYEFKIESWEAIKCIGIFKTDSFKDIAKFICDNNVPLNILRCGITDYYRFNLDSADDSIKLWFTSSSNRKKHHRGYFTEISFFVKKEYLKDIDYREDLCREELLKYVLKHVSTYKIEQLCI